MVCLLWAPVDEGGPLFDVNVFFSSFSVSPNNGATAASMRRATMGRQAGRQADGPRWSSGSSPPSPS